MSFVVTMIIILVLSLIVLAFAQLVRREQRQAFDRQLSTQALYAAESGINDATDAIAQAINDPTSTLLDIEYDQCTGVNSFISRAGLNSTLDGAGGAIAYSCLLVDPSPETLEYSSVPEDVSVVVPLRAEGGAGIASIEIAWGSPGGSDVTSCPGVNAYPQSWPTTGCDVGMLRAELVPFSGTISRDTLITNRAIMFLQPLNANTSVSVPFAAAAGTSQGRRVADGCSTSRCTVTINSIPGMTRGYLRLRSIYRASPVTIRAFDATGNQLELTGAQAEIDATGRASDVLRRIRVRRMITTDNNEEAFPEFALQSARTICKRLSITNTTVTALSISGFTPTECQNDAFAP